MPFRLAPVKKRPAPMRGFEADQHFEAVKNHTAGRLNRRNKAMGTPFGPFKFVSFQRPKSMCH